MPTRKPATVKDVESFNGYKKLNVSFEEAKRLAESNQLTLEQSVFSDPGDDYNKLVSSDGRVVGFWPGY